MNFWWPFKTKPNDEMIDVNIKTLIDLVNETYFEWNETHALYDFQKMFIKMNKQIDTIKNGIIEAKKHLSHNPDAAFYMLNQQKFRLQNILEEYTKEPISILKVNALKAKQTYDEESTSVQETILSIKTSKTKSIEALAKNKAKVAEALAAVVDIEKTCQSLKFYVKILIPVLWILIFGIILLTVKLIMSFKSSGFRLSNLKKYFVVFSFGWAAYGIETLRRKFEKKKSEQKDSINIMDNLEQEGKIIQYGIKMFNEDLKGSKKRMNELKIAGDNTNSKILVFEEITEILFNRQKILQALKDRLDKFINIYASYNRKHIPVQSITKCDEKCFTDEMQNIFVEIENVKKRFRLQTISLSLAFSD